jgi:hypothetical protein
MAYVINYKEVTNMPGRNGTGPMGAGAMTGRGMGLCAGAAAVSVAGLGLELACRRGFGGGFRRNSAKNQSSPPTQKELLQEQRELLQSRLEMLDKQLENL